MDDLPPSILYFFYLVVVIWLPLAFESWVRRQFWTFISVGLLGWRQRSTETVERHFLEQTTAEKNEEQWIHTHIIRSPIYKTDNDVEPWMFMVSRIRWAETVKARMAPKIRHTDTHWKWGWEREKAQGLAHTKKRVGEKVFQMKQGDRQDAWKGIGTGQAEERGKARMMNGSSP